ncbi:PIN domain-containing protein [Neobacillus mesonae]|uniref:PIN domain-containing protein n=1 Tax=Neobacillus mesonae TaxID=1193713 RepID=UPI00203DF104|nr:PIN domain-containing protein [Neobacillus mesonae]MCM3569849.1 PIN domain-containing protein [Neobacillus mesonae]
MNIFLDSNILFSDPFFQNNFSRKFVELVREVKGKLYVSDVVYQEVINNYKKEVRKRRKALGKAHHELNKLLQTKVDHTVQTDSIYVEELICFYQQLIEEGYMSVISHTAFDMFSEIVQRALDNKKPFADQKEEFKDTVIWLTYAKFAEQHKMENCFFLSNNTKEFYASDKTSLHSHLLEDTQRFTAYKSIEEFLTMESANIQNMQQQDIQEKRQLIQLIDWAESHLSESYVQQIIEDTFMKELEWELDDYVRNLSDTELNELTGISIGLGTANSEYIVSMSVNTYEREIYPSEIIIYGSLDVEHELSLYLDNGIRDKEEDRFISAGSDTVSHKVEFTFTIDLDYRPGNFEVKRIDISDDKEVYTYHGDPTDLF